MRSVCYTFAECALVTVLGRAWPHESLCRPSIGMDRVSGKGRGEG